MVLIDSNSTVLSIGDSLPHFRLQKVGGGEVDSRSISDPVLVVVFTCNHCPYAQACEGRLIDLQKEFADRGVVFVLISSNDAEHYPEDSFEEMAKRASDKKYPFPYCHDESQEIARNFGALCTPHCFVFDRQRKLQYKGRVDDNWKDPSAVKERNVHDAISAVLEGNNPPKTEANAIGCSIKWKV